MNTIIKNREKIQEATARWTDKIYPSREEFLKALSERKLVIYHGIDPTASHLHLGHSTNLLLLKKLQELGHEIVFLVGDFTAQIGDPTGKANSRRALTKKEIRENYKTYKRQAAKILDFQSKKNPVKFKFNSQWLGRMKAEEIIKLASNFTHGQMIKRKMFQERIGSGQEIYLHEFLYPLFQGYDSFALNCDAEIGGTDQTFNMLRGRDLMKMYRKKEKFVITTPLLENPKTGEKLMSKSQNNFIAIDESPREMYGKAMALPDEVIIPCLKLCTEIPLKEVLKEEENLKLQRVNPRDVKTKLAQEIVRMYYGEKVAQETEEEFKKVFKEKEIPSNISQIKLREKSLNILDLLVKVKITTSKSKAKELVLQGGVKIDDEAQKDWRKIVEIKKGMVIQSGKRKFVKLN